MNELIQDSLIEDEEILWSAQPNLKKSFNRADIILIPLSILITMFCIFFIVIGLLIGTMYSILFGFIPFIISMYLMFGRFLYKKYVKKNTYFYVTNKRVMVLDRTSRKKVRYEHIKWISSINKEKQDNGSGTIYFGKTPPFWMKTFINTGRLIIIDPYGLIPLTFYDLENVDEVYKLVNEIKSSKL